MDIDRKYRQKGYMQSYQQDRGGKKKEAPPKPQERIGPRQPQMPGTRTISRCAQCGTVLPALTEPLGPCPQCGFALHSCKQCAHFDPASRFECTQPIPERIPNKTAGNDCSFFTLRTMVEREAGSTSMRPEDARRAFENLFKK